MYCTSLTFFILLMLKVELGVKSSSDCHHSDSHCNLIESTAHERRYTHVNVCTREGEMRGAEGGGAEQGTPLLLVKEEMAGCSAE